MTLAGDGVRLQKVLAAAGIGSRRACEEMIAQGRVEVDGRRVREMGVRVDPDTAVIHVDGIRVPLPNRSVHLAFNKPVGVLSAMSDASGRPNLGDYVADRRERLFHVGRLDIDTEGLILLTNDGELAHRLTHPSFEVPKTYLAEIIGPVPRDLGRRLKAGLELDDGPASVDEFRVLSSAGSRVMVEIVLHEGRNRIVRRLLGASGFDIQRLVRVRLGSVSLGDLRPGRWRQLSRVEVGELYSAVAL